MPKVPPVVELSVKYPLFLLLPSKWNTIFVIFVSADELEIVMLAFVFSAIVCPWSEPASAVFQLALSSLAAVICKVMPPSLIDWEVPLVTCSLVRLQSFVGDVALNFIVLSAQALLPQNTIRRSKQKSINLFILLTFIFIMFFVLFNHRFLVAYIY